MTHVYFIQAGDERGPIKIGVASRIASRLRGMQTCCPLELRVRFAMDFGDDAFSVESALHRLWDHCRIRQLEWFACSRPILDGIEALKKFEIAAETTKIETPGFVLRCRASGTLHIIRLDDDAICELRSAPPKLEGPRA